MKKLIIQGHDIEPIIPSLMQVAKTDQVDVLSPTAFRLSHIHPSDALTALCRQAPIDWAIVDSDLSLSQFGLLASDMDSTLITIECIDEIADLAGVKPKVAEITASAMRGEIDFVESLRRRVGLLAGLDEQALDTVYRKRLHYNPGAKVLIDAAKAAGLRTLLVSGGFTFFTERIMDELGMDYHVSNTLEVVNGKLTGRVLGDIVDSRVKANALVHHCQALGLAASKSIAIGDGANDLVMMQASGLSIAYHAKPIVAAQAMISINHVGLDGILALFD